MIKNIILYRAWKNFKLSVCWRQLLYNTDRPLCCRLYPLPLSPLNASTSILSLFVNTVTTFNFLIARPFSETKTLLSECCIVMPFIDNSILALDVHWVTVCCLLFYYNLNEMKKTTDCGVAYTSDGPIPQASVKRYDSAVCRQQFHDGTRHRRTLQVVDITVLPYTTLGPLSLLPAVGRQNAFGLSDK